MNKNRPIWGAKAINWILKTPQPFDVGSWKFVRPSPDPSWDYSSLVNHMQTICKKKSLRLGPLKMLLALIILCFYCNSGLGCSLGFVKFHLGAKEKWVHLFSPHHVVSAVQDGPWVLCGKITWWSVPFSLVLASQRLFSSMGLTMNVCTMYYVLVCLLVDLQGTATCLPKDHIARKINLFEDDYILLFVN